MKFIYLFAFTLLFFSCKKANNSKHLAFNNSTIVEDKTSNNDIKITPIEHATAVLEWNNKTIYIDPFGGAMAFKKQNKPDLILITDIHGDHLSIKTLNELQLTNATTIVAPQAVYNKLPKTLQKQTTLLANNESKNINGIKITGVPMYNLRDGVTFHAKGRGNGYIIKLGSKNVYFSGDTEDIEEMRSLKNIDIAFICMNLPYTMPVESAADGVLAFKPKKVYPYHYRNKDKTLSNVSKFKELIEASNSNIEVVQLNWYPKNN